MYIIEQKEQHTPHKKPSKKSDAPERETVPVPLVEPAVLFMFTIP
jgi:hypothetical protein